MTTVIFLLLLDCVGTILIASMPISIDVYFTLHHSLKVSSKEAEEEFKRATAEIANSPLPEAVKIAEQKVLAEDWEAERNGKSLRTKFRVLAHYFTAPLALSFILPGMFTSIWLWLYAGAGFILKAAHRFDVGFRWFNSKCDIEKKPLQSIGFVAGPLLAIAYWTAVIVSRVVG